MALLTMAARWSRHHRSEDRWETPGLRQGHRQGDQQGHHSGHQV